MKDRPFFVVFCIVIGLSVVLILLLFLMTYKPNSDLICIEPVGSGCARYADPEDIVAAEFRVRDAFVRACLLDQSYTLEQCVQLAGQNR